MHHGAAERHLYRPLGCYAMELEGEVDEARAASVHSDEYDSDDGP